MLSCLLQKFQRVTSSHDQVLAELEAANRDLQVEQNKVIVLQNQLKQGSSSSIILAEVNCLHFQEVVRKFSRNLLVGLDADAVQGKHKVNQNVVVLD